MADISVPEPGLILGEVPMSSSTKNSTHGSQAMRIAFADSSVLDEVLKHGAGLKISFGKSMVWDSTCGLLSLFRCSESLYNEKDY